MYIHMDIDGYDLLNVRHILYSGIFMKSVAITQGAVLCVARNSSVLSGSDENSVC